METRKKKSFKRLFAFLMAFVMVTTLAVSAVFAADPTFKDVPKDYEFYDEIEDLAAKKIVSGFGTTGLFKPEEKLTRAQAAKMIAGAAKIKVSPGFKTKFTDVDTTVDMYEHIWALEEAEIVKGWGTTKEFRPDENIERGHVAKMIVKAFELEAGAYEFDFSDLPKNDEEVAEAIEVLASNDIVHGYGSTGLFKPAELVLRGQFSKMLSRAMALAASELKIVSVKTAGNDFREEQAAAMTITIGAEFNGVAIDLTDAKIEKIVVKLNGSTLIKTLDYLVAGKVVTIDADVLNALVAGTYNVDITLNDDVAVPTQVITVRVLKQAGLEVLSVVPDSVVVKAEQDIVITLEEWDALGGNPAINFNGVVVKVDGVALKATEFSATGSAVTIKDSYVKELKVGEYEVSITLLNGLSAEAEFEVYDKSSLALGKFHNEEYPVDGDSDISAAVTKTMADGTPDTAPTELKSVKVNGVVLSASRYTYSSGNLVIKKAYLKTLALGEYQVVVEADDLVTKASKFKIIVGSLAKATFSIEKKFELKAFEVLPVEVKLEDSKGNVLKETDATVALDGVGSVALDPSVNFVASLPIKTDANGKATVYFKSDVAGKAQLNVGSAAALKSEVFDVVPIVTLEGEYDATYGLISNAQYGNVVSLSSDYKVTGSLKYHKTDPTGMDMPDFDHYFLVFTIKGLPADTTVKLTGLQKGVAVPMTVTLNASECFVWGVEADENIKIEITNTVKEVDKTITLDLSALGIE